MGGFPSKRLCLTRFNPSDRPNGMPAAQHQRSDGAVIQSLLLDNLSYE